MSEHGKRRRTTRKRTCATIKSRKITALLYCTVLSFRNKKQEKKSADTSREERHSRKRSDTARDICTDFLRPGKTKRKECPTQPHLKTGQAGKFTCCSCLFTNYSTHRHPKKDYGAAIPRFRYPVPTSSRQKKKKTGSRSVEKACRRTCRFTPREAPFHTGKFFFHAGKRLIPHRQTETTRTAGERSRKPEPQTPSEKKEAAKGGRNTIHANTDWESAV